MTLDTKCALCLATTSDLYLKVFSDDTIYLDIPQIISKYLWFSLVPETHPNVCGECWKSLEDFHQFYTNLESIHYEETGNIELKTEQSLDSTIFVEEREEERYTPDVGVNDQNERPKRISKVPLRYQLSSICLPDSENKHLVMVDGGTDFDDDNQTDDHTLDYDVLSNGDNDAPDEQKSLDDVEQWSSKAIGVVAVEEPVKRRRGRPPKRKIDTGNDQQIVSIQIKTEASGTSTSPIPIKRGRGRPPKPKPDASADIATADEQRKKSRRKSTRKTYSSESETENESDSEYASFKSKATKANDDNDGPSAQKARDDRIFKYIEEFVCHYCIEKIHFKRFIDADRHYKLVHNEPGYIKCPTCDKKCFTPGMFVSHMETHEDPEKNRCEICGKNTDCNISLRKHMRTHQAQLEENMPFPCGLCKRRFETEEQVEKHEKLHVPKSAAKRTHGPDVELLEFYKRIYCDVCETESPESTSFENYSELSEHMAREHNRGAYLKCPICYKRNLYRPQLINHIDMHNNPEKYRCEVCKEIHQNLDQHMIKAHTPNTAGQQVKKHKCDQCGRTFNFLANLKMHMDCVHALKNVCCKICNKHFSYKAYRVHQRTAHVDLLLMCEQCPKMFKTKHALDAHKAQHDSSLVQFQTCALCGKQIRSSNMPKHMKTIHSQEDPVSCNMCGKTFRSTFHMVRHRKNTCAATIDSRKHKCEICGKGFAMKLTMMEHMTTHTHTNQYQCAFCFKSFGYISNLYKHRKKAHPLEWQEVQARPEEGIATVIMVRN